MSKMLGGVSFLTGCATDPKGVEICQVGRSAAGTLFANTHWATRVRTKQAGIAIKIHRDEIRDAFMGLRCSLASQVVKERLSGPVGYVGGEADLIHTDNSIRTD